MGKNIEKLAEHGEFCLNAEAKLALHEANKELQEGNGFIGELYLLQAGLQIRMMREYGLTEEAEKYSNSIIKLKKEYNLQ